jgi:hypothetical protein
MPTTSRVMAGNRPYGKFYDFYSVSLETFGSTLMYEESASYSENNREDDFSGSDNFLGFYDE